MSAGRLILPLAEPALTSAGLPNSAATLTVYNTGTTTLSAIYGDSLLVSPILNPQTSNAAGRFYAQSTEIWADNGTAYDCVLALSNGETFTFLNVYVLGAAPVLGAYLQNPSVVLTGVPTAPTPAANDVSSKIATTQFVSTAITAAIAAIASPIPTGMLAGFAMPSAPTGFLLCDGSAVSRTTYATLFAVVGTRWGTGDGSTTFNLPNFLGVFPRGFNPNGTGPDASRVFALQQTDQIQGHVHYSGVVSTTGSPPAYAYATTTNDIPGSSGNTMHTDNNTAQQQGLSSVPKTDGTNGTPRTGIETRPTNNTQYICIKT